MMESLEKLKNSECLLTLELKGLILELELKGRMFRPGGCAPPPQPAIHDCCPSAAGSEEGKYFVKISMELINSIGLKRFCLLINAGPIELYTISHFLDTLYLVIEIALLSK